MLPNVGLPEASATPPSVPIAMATMAVPMTPALPCPSRMAIPIPMRAIGHSRPTSPNPAMSRMPALTSSGIAPRGIRSRPQNSGPRRMRIVSLTTRSRVETMMTHRSRRTPCGRPRHTSRHRLQPRLGRASQSADRGPRPHSAARSPPGRASNARSALERGRRRLAGALQRPPADWYARNPSRPRSARSDVRLEHRSPDDDEQVELGEPGGIRTHDQGIKSPVLYR